MSDKERALKILSRQLEFEVIDEQAKTKRLCRFVRWSHNNKIAILKDINDGRDIAVDGKMFLEFIGFD